jgi:DTW domain-containing protein YfiP
MPLHAKWSVGDDCWLSEQTRKNHNKLGFSTFENPYRTLNSFNQDDNDDALQQLFNGIVSQERGSLARGITLIESAHPKNLNICEYILTGWF